MNTTAHSTIPVNAAQVADRYLNAWNETDPGRRAALVQQTFGPDIEYLDPMMDACGHEALAGLMAAVQDRFKGHRFELVGTPEAHHDVVRFSWSLRPDDAPPVAKGTDVVELDGHGRLRRVTGFLDYLAGA